MSRFGKITRSILVWTYDRGTIQYDIICALILAFIFLVPSTCFVSPQEKEKATSPKIESSTSQQPSVKDNASQ